jgi:glycosyltransferase involved in cell wall biosynthesis
LPVRLVGVPLLLDLHEAMPEFFRSRFPRASNRVAHGLLNVQERLSIAISTAVVTVNHVMAERLVGLGVAAAKVHVVANSASLRRFDPTAFAARPFAADGVVRLVYAGALTPTYELDVVVDALARLAIDRRDVAWSLDVYGRGDAETTLRARVERAGLGERITFHGRIPIEDVPAAIAGADIGLAPTRRDRFTDVSLSTKLYEYAAMGKPVVASRLPLVASTFAPDTIRAYDPGDPADLARALLAVIDDPDGRAARVARTADLVREASWERRAPAYVALVERLIAGRPAPDGRR